MLASFLTGETLCLELPAVQASQTLIDRSITRGVWRVGSYLG